MSTPGDNEGFRILEEFTCEAATESSQISPEYHGRGMNPGVNVLTEMVAWASQPTVSTERMDQFRSMSSLELLGLLRSSASELSREELIVIHDIAVERLEDHGPFLENASELSQEVFVVALNKIA